VTLQIPCTEKFISETGWEAEIPFEESLKVLLDYWRKKTEQSLSEQKN